MCVHCLLEWCMCVCVFTACLSGVCVYVCSLLAWSVCMCVHCLLEWCMCVCVFTACLSGVCVYVSSQTWLAD